MTNNTKDFSFLPDRKELQNIIDLKAAPKSLDEFLIDVDHRLRNVTDDEIQDRKIMLNVSHLDPAFVEEVDSVLVPLGYEFHYNYCYEKYFVSWKKEHKL